jgi:hypothetical protein
LEAFATESPGGCRGGMLNPQSGDRIELCYEDAPTTKILATVGRLLTDRDEGMGSEVEDYAACWIEVTVHEPETWMRTRLYCLAPISSIG